MKKVNEVNAYVRPEVEEIDLVLSANILEGSNLGGEATNEDGEPAW